MKSYKITYNNGNKAMIINAHYVEESVNGWVICSKPACGIAEVNFYERGKSIASIEEVIA